MTTTQRTFCRICEPSCSLIANLDDAGAVTGLSPDAGHPLGGTACHKGLTFLNIHNHPDRLDWPLRRSNPKGEAEGRFERVGWDGTMADISARLIALREQYGPDAIGTYLGNPMAFNGPLIAASEAFISALGTRMTFGAATQDCSNKFIGSWAVYGSKGSQPIPDIYNTDYLLCLGSNPGVSRWTLISTPNDPDVLKGIRRRGGKIVYVNPREIGSSPDGSEQTLRITPGTDVYFLAAILNEIDRIQGFDHPLVQSYGRNLDDLRTFVVRYPVERVADVVGISGDAIRQVAVDLVAARSASVYLSLGVNQSRQGVLCYWLVQMISFVTGNLGKAGGAVRPPALIEDYPTAEMGSMESSVGPIQIFEPLQYPTSMPGAMLPDLIEGGDVRAMIVFAGNPLLSMGGEDRVRAAFAKLELLIVIDIFRSATAEMADYILPAADWLEREDINLFGSSGMQSFPSVQYTPAVTTPAGERRSESWIVMRLMELMGLNAERVGPLDDGSVDTALVQSVLAAAGMSIEQLRQAPYQMVPIENAPPESFFDRCVRHPDGKVDCCPQPFAATGLFDRCEKLFLEARSEKPGTLKLVMLRTRHMHNSWFANTPELRSGKHAVNALHMCEQDAAARCLHDGDWVRISNDNGEVVTRLEIDDQLRPGVVAMSHGYGHAAAPGLKVASAKPGVNYNRLVPTGPHAFEPLSQMSWMTGLPVSVEQITSWDQP